MIVNKNSNATVEEDERKNTMKTKPYCDENQTCELSKFERKRKSGKKRDRHAQTIEKMQRMCEAQLIKLLYHY